MVRVRRLHAERRSRGWIAIASRITHRPGWAAALAAGPFARTLPERDGGDGFFAARLERRA
jgi:16S rRNA C967 or C1407 C5-methylase (RsmB/RsmF family)